VAIFGTDPQDFPVPLRVGDLLQLNSVKFENTEDYGPRFKLYISNTSQWMIYPGPLPYTSRFVPLLKHQQVAHENEEISQLQVVQG
jgi:hypothetical protein